MIDDRMTDGYQNKKRGPLHAHYIGTISIKPLSEIAHLSDSQLQPLFRRSTRMTISQYVGQLRVGGACQLLAQTDLPLAQIDDAVGFSDAAHFPCQFRAARGLATIGGSFAKSSELKVSIPARCLPT
ncbi:helix-turn-helix domain-containing protein [Agrobacterium radiobacter]|uniref:helix-turn-helix domain-containing protein n=1 Tax=Agrobacterium radiobacter TaxID=362 RepID=UPI003CE4A503